MREDLCPLFLIANSHSIHISTVTLLSQESMKKKKDDVIPMPAMVMHKSKMSLILDSYLDIFSSFDPRPYEERSLSDDFLDECKKMVIDKGVDLVELRLMIPESSREVHNETLIKKRLHSYFLLQAHIEQKKRRKDMHHWLVMVTIGVIIGVIVSYILHMYAFDYLYTTIITVIWEPASWLMIWNWADKLLKYFWWETDQQHEFAHRLSRAKIQFYGY